MEEVVAMIAPQKQILNLPERDKVLSGSRFVIYDRIEEPEAVYNVAKGIFPDASVIKASIDYVLGNVDKYIETRHYQERAEERNVFLRPFDEVLQTGTPVELRFGRQSWGLKAGVFRVPFTGKGEGKDDVYVLAFAKKPEGIRVYGLSAFRCGEYIPDQERLAKSPFWRTVAI